MGCAEGKGDTHCGGQRDRLQKVAPPAPCRGQGCSALWGQKAGLLSAWVEGQSFYAFWAGNIGQNTIKEVRPPLPVLSLVGWPRKVGSEESPAAVPANSRVEDLQSEVKNQEPLG